MSDDVKFSEERFTAAAAAAAAASDRWMSVYFVRVDPAVASPSHLSITSRRLESHSQYLFIILKRIISARWVNDAYRSAAAAPASRRSGAAIVSGNRLSGTRACRSVVTAPAHSRTWLRTCRDVAQNFEPICMKISRLISFATKFFLWLIHSDFQ